MQHTQYISTRGQMAAAGFTDVLLAGLAPDGGLAVPSRLPVLSPEQIEAWRPLGYADLATEVIGLFATDIPAAHSLTPACQVGASAISAGGAPSTVSIMSRINSSLDSI